MTIDEVLNIASDTWLKRLVDDFESVCNEHRLETDQMTSNLWALSEACIKQTSTLFRQDSTPEWHALKQWLSNLPETFPRQAIDRFFTGLTEVMLIDEFNEQLEEMMARRRTIIGICKDYTEQITPDVSQYLRYIAGNYIRGPVEITPLVCRATIELRLMDLMSPNSSKHCKLHDLIDKAHDTGCISHECRELCHDLRRSGNSVAHYRGKGNTLESNNALKSIRTVVMLLIELDK